MSGSAHRVWDLEERVVAFAASAVRLAERLPRTPIGAHLGDQLVRAAVSPAPNYAEAQGAESRRDFVHKMRVCQKELREALVLLRLVERLELVQGPELPAAIAEANELVAIFTASVVTALANGRRARAMSGQEEER